MGESRQLPPETVMTQVVVISCLQEGCGWEETVNYRPDLGSAMLSHTLAYAHGEFHVVSQLQRLR